MANMKRISLLWGLLLVLIAASTWSVFQRGETELSNNKFEMIVPYDDIAELENNDISQTITVEKALNDLKEAGLDAVSIEPDTLSSLEDRDVLNILSKEKLSDLLYFTDTPVDLPAEEGIYFTKPTDESYDKVIRETFDPEVLTIQNKTLYFIQGPEMEIEEIPFGFNQAIIKQIKDSGLNVVLRVLNADPELNRQQINELVSLKDEQINTILFSGQEVIGYQRNNPHYLSEYTDKLQKAGYNFYNIEFAGQDGMQTLARTSEYSIIRLHSLNLNNGKTLDENIDRAIRAVKERNMRALFFRLPSEDSQTSLNDTVKLIRNVETHMPAIYESGKASPFSTIQIPFWVTLGLLISSVIFVYLAVTHLLSSKLAFAASGLTAILGFGYIITNKLLILQLLALGIAVITPIFAAIPNQHYLLEKKSVIGQYLKAVGISIIGILLVIGLLNGNEFLTGIEVFRGVKLVYVLPILYMTFYAFWGQIRKVLMTKVVYWHTLVIFMAGGIVLYYIIRSGNTAPVSAFELMLRQKLENLLYARPRTKEFLIGFPFYVLAIYLMIKKEKWAKFLLIPGVIGFLSIMNTFTHLHIPLYISVLRTFYGIVLGFLIGYAFIYLYKLGKKFFLKVMSRRLQ
jgi:hypothetical protein